MRLVRGYILENLAKIFFPIFMVLFFISSVILFIRIATVTAIIKINFLEFIELYFYSLPIMLFFVLPVTFFVSSVITLSKLSREYELPVLFSLGLSPAYFFRIFIPPCAILSCILLVFSFVLIPSSDNLYAHFINQKKKNIDVNLHSSEFAQKLDSWLVYVGNTEGNTYKDVVLFSKKGFDRETFIVADQIDLSSDGAILEIDISNGRAYLNNMTDVMQIDYEKLITRVLAIPENFTHRGVWEYWNMMWRVYPIEEQGLNERERKDSKKALRNFSTYLLVSLFPMLSVALIPLLGIMHPRFAHAHTSFYLIFCVAFFYGCVHIVATYFPIQGILPCALVWIFGCYWLYRKQIARIF